MRPKVWRRGDSASASGAPAPAPPPAAAPAGPSQNTVSPRPAAHLPPGGTPKAVPVSAPTHAHASSTSLPPRSQPNPSTSGQAAAPPHGKHTQGKRPHGGEGQLQQQQQAPGKRPKLAIDNTAQNAAAVANKLREKERELQELRRKLEEGEQLLKKKKQEEEAQEAARQRALQQQRELQRRREALSRGFAAVADSVPALGAAGPSGRSARGHALAGEAAKPAALPVADAAEVQRVLDSSDDYAVLKLHAGATLAQVRRSYRQMAIALHPDKCRHTGAAAAFQRLGAAYSSVTKALGG